MTATASPAPSGDVLIAGGGLVGLTLALGYGRAGLRVTVVDRVSPAVQAGEAHDGRASAIAYGSARVLEGIGLWPLLAGEAEPILDIRVSDGPSRLFLHYDHRALGSAPLGYIVENLSLRRALVHALADCPAVRILAPAEVVRLEPGPGAVTAVLGDGTRLTAALAVAADGRRSALRQAAGIGATEWAYAQTGIVTSFAHERPHRGVAHERFLPAGPFAVLPLPTRVGVHRSSLVWTERAALAPLMMALDDAAFAAEIARRFGPSLGRITATGRRWAYPLGLLMAERYVAPRLALVGDAAHAIHPIAGQGLNLGLRDVAALLEATVDAHRLGLDLADGTALARYQSWRRFDNLVLMAVTDGLNRLFSTDLAPVRWARDLGLGLIDRMPAVKRQLMRHAMGTLGDLPRLVRGEPL